MLEKQRTGIPLAGGLIVLAGLLAYQGSYSVPFLYDDYPAIVDNPTIRSLWPVGKVFLPPGTNATVSGRPVLNASLALNYAIGGQSAGSYHALNLLIHLCAGLVLFGIVRRTLGRLRKESCTWPAFGIALVWTVHPLQTEAVTYIVQRAESLMGLFYLLTLYCFVRGVETGGTEAGGGIVPPGSELRKARMRAEPALGPLAFDRSQRPEARNELRYEPSGTIPPPASSSRLWLALSCFACLLGMATKEVMVTAPVVVLMYDRAFMAGSFREAWRRRRAYYRALAATWLLLLVLAAETGGTRGGTVGFGAGIPWLPYFRTQFEAVARYLKLAVWPHPLVFDYGPLGVRGFQAAICIAVVTALAAGTLIALWRKPALGFLGFWFFAILAPTSLIPGTMQMAAEHRMYLPLAAVVVAVALGFDAMLGWVAECSRGRIVAGLVEAGSLPGSSTPATPASFVAGPLRHMTPLALTMFAVPLVVLTFYRNETYRSPLRLWAETAAERPGDPEAHFNLGNMYFQGGKLADAEAQYRLTLQQKPDYADAHYNLGNALLVTGDAAGSIPEFRVAIRLHPDRPEMHNNLGYALMLTGRRQEAVDEFQTALRLDPGFAPAKLNISRFGVPSSDK